MAHIPFFISAFILSTVLFFFSLSPVSANDLSVLEIIITNSSPIENDNITIRANISNSGFPAANPTVEFLDDLIGITNVTVALDPSSTALVNISYSPQIGTNNITVRVDPANFISESDETNNNLTKNVSVSGYQTYWGVISSSFVFLGVRNNTFLMRWNSSIQGTVLVMDTDSNVDFSDLKELGRTTSNFSSTADFAQADSVLGMSQFNDSIRNRFAAGSAHTPNSTESFVVFRKTLAQVPIIGSSENSGFITGVLWDIADDNDGEFDSSEREDLIFASRVNASQSSEYGTIDFLIKVPALLRSYKGTTNTLDLFVELT